MVSPWRIENPEFIVEVQERVRRSPPESPEASEFLSEPARPVLELPCLKETCQPGERRFRSTSSRWPASPASYCVFGRRSKLYGLVGDSQGNNCRGPGAASLRRSTVVAWGAFRAAEPRIKEAVPELLAVLETPPDADALERHSVIGAVLDAAVQLNAQQIWCAPE